MIILAYVLIGVITAGILREAYLAYSPGVYEINSVLMTTLGLTLWPIIWGIIILDIFLIMIFKNKELRNE